MIVVVGSLNRDYVLRVPQLPAAGQTLTATGFEAVCGGKGANQAVAAAKLGAEVTMVGCVGDDDDGRALRESLAAAGAVDRVRIAPEPTGAAFICVADDGENHIVLRPGANEAVSVSQVEEAADLIADADVLLVQLEVPLGAVSRAVEIAHDAETLIILDPAPAVPLPGELLNKVGVISPNQTEAAVLVGPGSPDEQARRLQDRHGCRVAMKLGGEGTLWFDGGPPIAAPAFEVSPVDTTAAGDAFTAALAVALAESIPIREALRFACATGGLATTKPGAQPALPTRDEVDALLSR